jgi:hypothetical protein
LLLARTVTFCHDVPMSFPARFTLIIGLFAGPFVRAELVSTGVGVVRSQVVTSREVQVGHLLDVALFEPKPKDKLRLLPVDSKTFSKAIADTFLEAVVSLEAQNFNLIQISDDELKASEKKALRYLKDQPVWKNLQVSGAEFEAGVRRKVQAKKFVQFRAQSSVLPVTESEARKYFNENRLKFGNLPYENFREDIKSYLSRTHVEQRLKDWYDVLLNKYQVKNLIAEM